MVDLRASLPAEWDFGRDLAVLVGRGTEAVARWLAEAGQARLLALLPPGADAGKLPPRAEVVRTPQELVARIAALPGSAPVHVVVRKVSDPWASLELLRETARAAADGLRARRLVADTLALQGPVWLRQGLGNLHLLADVPSVAALEGAFRGRPCIVASPGPSLARNVHLLERARGRALLVSGTHALAALGRAGAAPHLLLAADPGELAWHFHESGDARAAEAYVVGATCRRAELERPARRRFSFASNGGLDDWIFEALGENAVVPSGGSVACSAVGLALRLGCDPIVLVGQDLSFPEHQAYAEGTLDGNARVVLNPDGSFFLRKPGDAVGPGAATADGGLRTTRDQALCQVPGYHGGSVPTSESFHAFLRWFEALAAERAGRTRLVNCTEGGALIAGWEQRPLAEVLESWSEPLADVGARLDAAGLDDTARRARRGRLGRHVRSMLAALDPCLELAARCERLAKAAADGDPRSLERLRPAEQRLAKALRPVRLLSLVAHHEVLAAQEQARLARDVAANLAAARRLFAVVARAARELRDPLRAAHARLSGNACGNPCIG